MVCLVFKILAQIPYGTSRFIKAWGVCFPLVQKEIVLRLEANTCKGIAHVAVVHFCDRVFAELDDKTPLSMLLSAAEHNTSNVGVCIASSGALVRSKLHRGLGWFPAFDLYPASRTQAHCRGRLHGHRQLGSHRLTSLTSRSA